MIELADAVYRPSGSTNVILLDPEGKARVIATDDHTQAALIALRVRETLQAWVEHANRQHVELSTRFAFGTHCGRCDIEWMVDGAPVRCPNCGQITTVGPLPRRRGVLS